MRESPRALLDAGRADDALAAARRALAADPDDAEALALSAEARLTLEQWADALSDADRLLRVDPRSVWARRMRCVALENLRRFDAAIESAREAIALDPRDANAHFLLAKNLWQTSRDAEALGALQRAVDLEPDVPRYRFILARFSADANPARAEELLERIVADEPAHLAALNDLGALLHRRGQTRRAAELYARALRADPGFEIAGRNLARIAATKGVTFALAVLVVATLLCGTQLVIGVLAWRAGHPIGASCAVVLALGGLAVTARIGRHRLRERRALAATPPERSDA